MTKKERNDYLYVCSLVEYIARRTNNRRGAVVTALGKEGIRKQLYDAEVNHCLSFEQVSDEVIGQYQIRQGDFDTITDCKYPRSEEHTSGLQSLTGHWRIVQYHDRGLCRTGGGDQ